MPETTLAEGAGKQATYEAWEQERSSDPQSLAADLYTATTLPVNAPARLAWSLQVFSLRITCHDPAGPWDPGESPTTAA